MAGLYRLKKLSLNKIKRLFSFSSEKSSSLVENKEEKNNIIDNEDDHNSEPKGKSGTGGKEKPKGHGRNGKKDFAGAKKISHSHECLIPGDQCPSCLIGKVYPINPGVFIQFTGTSPIQCTVHELEKLRCNACGEIFTAKLPQGVKKNKYDFSADVAMAMQKYGLGIPFYRLQQWQRNLKIPLPASTQWERVENLGNSIYPVYDQLILVAAERQLSFLDDTGGRILDFEKKIKKSKRTGIYTTGIVAKFDKEKIIHLFFTGNQHAGENIDRLLSKRFKIDPMIIMSDALSRNKSKNFLTIWCKCLTHARRLFFDQKDDYPKMVAFIMHLFGKIYYYDKLSSEKNHTPEQRMKYHQNKSASVLRRMRRWCLKMFYLKKIEPNEELGSAIKYLLTHWEQLTQFLRVPGAPICNNTVERSLKMCILHRKNSLFYKTSFGAYIGDMMMSLIKTCQSCFINPFEYLLPFTKIKLLLKNLRSSGSLGIIKLIWYEIPFFK